MTYFAFVSTVVCALAFLVVPGVDFGLPASAVQWGELAGVCGGGWGVQWFITVGLAHGAEGGGSGRGRGVVGEGGGREGGEGDGDGGRGRGGRGTATGGRAMNGMFLAMVFSLLGDWGVWGSVPGLWGWVGCGLVLGSAVWVACVEDGVGSEERGLGRERARGGEGEEGEEEVVGLLLDEGGGGKEGGASEEEEEDEDEDEDEEDGELKVLEGGLSTVGE